MKRRGIVVVLLLLAGLLIAPAAPAAAGPYCGIRWGSLAKSNGGAFGAGDMFAVRTGRHSCYDRVVIDVEGPFAGYSVGYVDTATATDGTVVQLRGGARLQIDARLSTQADQQGKPYFVYANDGTVADLRDVTGYRTLRQVSWAGSSDGVSRVAVGVRARLPFRAFLLPGPREHVTRLVIDVAHRW
ncbi:hypothetical protein ASD16_06335 [Cellulomonas sp. Root485]|uniref:AMIN-like domain-containing (lipo)protein n=1 Tax=Cellulomonas sp. Root485 TaxID=1736546 RepID=UPI0006F86141|nr:hypothetical protein [Cellulomonas sp. Root485]KQY25059.1 hypothetical protein ASD16_06335 [Cellulomonas sp. Root485]